MFDVAKDRFSFVWNMCLVVDAAVVTEVVCHRVMSFWHGTDEALTNEPYPWVMSAMYVYLGR
jgi:hypothetical protein